MKIRIRNMQSPATEKEVPNQFIIGTDIGRYFQSYGEVIAFIPNVGNKIVLSESWNYSRTTGKYRNIFLRESYKETVKKIVEGKYELVDFIDIK